jgi:hypothetical protein
MARLVAGVVILSLPIVAWGVWAVVMGGPEVLVGAAVGFLIGASIILAWGAPAWSNVIMLA